MLSHDSPRSGSELLFCLFWHRLARPSETRLWAGGRDPSFALESSGASEKDDVYHFVSYLPFAGQVRKPAQRQS
jgi:hypothetical protein